MYWYYKAFFGALVFIGLGVGVYFAWPSISKMLPEKKPDKTEENADNKDDGKNTNGPSGKTDGNQDNGNSGDDEVSADVEEVIQAAKKKMETGLFDEAVDIAQSVIEDKSVKRFSKSWYAAADLITDCNTTLLRTSAPSKRKHNHVVARGESLGLIAKRNNTSVEAIQRSNGIPTNSHNIRAGQSLRFFKGSWNLEAVKSEYILMVYFEGKFFKYYKVGIGIQNRTPVGKFEIVDKAIDPEYKGLPSGHKDNPLGSRWMRFVDNARPHLTGFGIHGTIEPDSIGKPSSQGCLRLRNDKVEELYFIVPVKTELVIKDN